MLKIAIVGAGKVARANYLPFLAAQSDVVLSYLSRTRAAADACARDFGGTVHETPAALLADDPDAVLVLTHETQRAEAIGALLPHRPRRLFFEKPLVAAHGQADVREADFFTARDLLTRAEAAGAETAMVFNYRFFETSRRAREAVAARGLGALRQASCVVHYACWSHCIDLLRGFGGPLRTIAALGGAEHGGAVDVAAAFTLEEGACGTIVGTQSPRFSLPLYDLFLNFEGGSVRLRDLDGALEIHESGSRYVETHALIANHSRWDQYNASFEKALDAYLGSVREGTAPPVPGRAGLEELQFEAALRRSIAQGRPVAAPQEFPLTPR